MYPSLLWKEWREHRLLVLCGICFCLLPVFFRFFSVDPTDTLSDIGEIFNILDTLFVVPLLVIILVINQFSGEMEDKTFSFLSVLPISRRSIWIMKVLFALFVLFLLDSSNRYVFNRQLKEWPDFLLWAEYLGVFSIVLFFTNLTSRRSYAYLFSFFGLFVCGISIFVLCKSILAPGDSWFHWRYGRSIRAEEVIHDIKNTLFFFSSVIFPVFGGGSLYLLLHREHNSSLRDRYVTLKVLSLVVLTVFGILTLRGHIVVQKQILEDRSYSPFNMPFLYATDQEAVFFLNEDLQPSRINFQTGEIDDASLPKELIYRDHFTYVFPSPNMETLAYQPIVSLPFPYIQEEEEIFFATQQGFQSLDIHTGKERIKVVSKRN